MPVSVSFTQKHASIRFDRSELMRPTTSSAEVLLTLLALLLAGCAALPTPFVPEKDTPSFDGMSALFAEAHGEPVHALLIHGILSGDA